jgi:hypothetical protein
MSNVTSVANSRVLNNSTIRFANRIMLRNITENCSLVQDLSVSINGKYNRIPNRLFFLAHKKSSLYSLQSCASRLLLLYHPFHHTCWLYFHLLQLYLPYPTPLTIVLIILLEDLPVVSFFCQIQNQRNST